MRILTLHLLLFTAAFSTLRAEQSSSSVLLRNNDESIQHYASRVHLPMQRTLDLGDGVKLETVLIPAGKFTMGTPRPDNPLVGKVMALMSGAILTAMVLWILIRASRAHTLPQYSLAYLTVMTLLATLLAWGGVRWHLSLQDRGLTLDELPAHGVTLTTAFYLGKYLVTQEQYVNIIGTNPSYFPGKDHPVEMVSWDDAQEFCSRLSRMTGQRVRLPTEAEWEYACRAGTRTQYYSGDSECDLGKVGWYVGNSNAGTHSVGLKQPNAFGLYDMHGNVWEWCQDGYRTYTCDEHVDPRGSEHRSVHAVRGGCWGNKALHCRSAIRRGLINDVRAEFNGFRVVVCVAAQEPVTNKSEP